MYAMPAILVIISLLTNVGANIAMNIEPTLRQKRQDSVTTSLAVLASGCSWRIREAAFGYYGCWCGKGHNPRCTGVKDDVDFCCYKHDTCYDRFKGSWLNKRDCDVMFYKCLKKNC